MLGFNSKSVPNGGLNVFTLFDSAAQAYMTPFFLPTSGIAIRQLQEAAADVKSPLHSHPDDFTLFTLGVFVPTSGEIFLEKAPVRVISLKEVLS